MQAIKSESDEKLEAAIREGLKKYQLPIEDNPNYMAEGLLKNLYRVFA